MAKEHFVIIRNKDASRVKDGNRIEVLARVAQVLVAHDVFRAIAELYPGEDIQLRQGSRVIARAVSQRREA